MHTTLETIHDTIHRRNVNKLLQIFPQNLHVSGHTVQTHIVQGSTIYNIHRTIETKVDKNLIKSSVLFKFL